MRKHSNQNLDFLSITIRKYLAFKGIGGVMRLQRSMQITSSNPSGSGNFPSKGRCKDLDKRQDSQLIVLKGILGKANFKKLLLGCPSWLWSTRGKRVTLLALCFMLGIIKTPP
jgi:hypothetical protein